MLAIRCILWMSGHVLILGGTGFVGSPLAGTLRQGGWNITVINRDRHKDSVEGIERLVADRNDISQMRNVGRMLTGRSFDAILDVSSYELPRTQLAWRCLASQTSHWIHLSSARVYSRATEPDHKESDLTGGSPLWGHYSEEESDAERFLMSQASSCRVTILRHTYLYGPKDAVGREDFVWRRLLRNYPLVVPEPKQDVHIQFLHVDDLVRAMESVLLRGIRAEN